MLRRITSLFVDGANYYNEDHVGLFDDVLMRLIVEIEAKTVAELAHRLAPIDNAPIQLMRRLAKDDDKIYQYDGDKFAVVGTRRGLIGQLNTDL